MHSFIFFDDWQDSAATMNRTLLSFTNLGCVSALQSEGQSNRSKSSGAKMSAIPRSISSTCGEDIWDITRGIHAKVAIPAKMKLRVRRSVQWDIVGKRSALSVFRRAKPDQYKSGSKVKGLRKWGPRRLKEVNQGNGDF